jgi:hypothetical protein
MLLSVGEVVQEAARKELLPLGTQPTVPGVLFFLLEMIQEGFAAHMPSIVDRGNVHGADPKYNWPSWGNGLTNNRFAAYERKIGPANVASVVVKKGWPVRVSSTFTSPCLEI